MSRNAVLLADEARRQDGDRLPCACVLVAAPERLAFAFGQRLGDALDPLDSNAGNQGLDI